jgi:hypothetical protein
MVLCWTCRAAGVVHCAFDAQFPMPVRMRLPLVACEIPSVFYAPLRQVIHKPNPGTPSR